MSESLSVVTTIPKYLNRPREVASRLTVLLLVLFAAWVGLAHIGGYQVHWSRFIAVLLALIAWWRAWPAAMGLVLALLLPVAASNPGAALVAGAVSIPALLAFLESPHALALVIATPVFLEYGVGPLPLLLLVALGLERHGRCAFLGLLMAITLATVGSQPWAAGYLGWGLPQVRWETLTFPLPERSWSDLASAIAGLSWPNAEREVAAILTEGGRILVDQPLPLVQILVWFIAPAVAYIVRGWILLAFKAHRETQHHTVVMLGADASAALVVAVLLLLGHIVAAPQFTSEPVTGYYTSNVVWNTVRALMLTLLILPVEHLVFRTVR